MSDYEKKLIRQGNAGYDRRTADDFVKWDIARIRKKTDLYDKVTMKTDDPKKYFIGYVIAKYDTYFVLEEAKRGYKEAFLWFDLLRYQKVSERMTDGKDYYSNQ